MCGMVTLPHSQPQSSICTGTHPTRCLRGPEPVPAPSAQGPPRNSTPPLQICRLGWGLQRAKALLKARLPGRTTHSSGNTTSSFLIFLCRARM